MSKTDTIADSLTMIRNAIDRNKDVVDIPGTNVLEEIIKILKNQGFINNYRIMGTPQKKRIRVYLKYDSKRESFISGIKRVSTPGRRMYKKNDEIPEVLNGLGISIVTTSKGIMTGKEARETGVGGEIICYVW